MNRQERIRQRVLAEFSPSQLEVRDDSANHAGHAGARPGGETHYHITARSARFTGLTRVAAQRLVYDALKSEFDSGLHALSLDVKGE